MPSIVTPLPVAGSVIDGFDVLDQVDVGAQSVIYRVSRDGEIYGLKLLRQTEDENGDGGLAFRREAAILTGLGHPGLVHIHQVGTSDGRPYLLMDLLRGETLRAALARRPRWAEAELVALARAAAGPLAAAHRAGLVHRDVKPENLFLTADGGTKVIDFGLAGPTGVRQDDDATIGTAAYSPPEQTGMLQRPVDGRSDLYALGVVLFEAATGQPPFASDDVGDLIRQHAVQAPPDLRIERPDLSPAFAAVVDRLLAKDPDDRYQSGEGLLADLDRLARHHRDGTGPADFAVGADDRPATVDGELPLIGRTAELDDLTAHWRRTADGGGGVVLVEGEPGLGKSRLARELLRLAGSEGALVLSGKAVAGSPFPLACLREALHRHLQQLRTLPSDRATEAVARLRRAAEGSGGMLGTFSPELGAYIGQRTKTVSTEDRQDQYVAAVAGFLVRLAVEHGGAVLCLDDVQWVDDASSRVLQGMSAMLRDAPLLILATARDDEPSRDGTERFLIDVGDSLRARLALRPLDEPGVAALVTEQLGGPVDADVARRLHVRGDGNPFATVEYLRAVVDAGLVRPSWGTFLVDTAGLDRLDLPADVIELVLRRVDGLGPDALALLTAGAAVGATFRPAWLQGALDLDEQRLGAAVADAVRARLIERRDGSEYAFVHDRIREAMLDPLGAAERADLHQRLAESFEALDPTDPDDVLALARLFRLGGRSPAKVHRWNVAAGHVALESYASAEAADLFGRAAEAAETAGIGVDATFEETFGLTLFRSGDVGAAHDHFRRALDLTDDPWVRARVFAHLGRIEFCLWNTVVSWEHVQDGLDAVGWALPANPVHFWLETAAQAIRGLTSTVTGRGFGSATDDERTELEIVIGLLETGSVVSYCSGRPLRMAAMLLRALPLANRLGETGELVKVYAQSSLLVASLGRADLAERIIGRSLAVAEMIGDPLLIAIPHLCRAYVHELAGDPERAAELANALLHDHARWLDVQDLMTAVSSHPISRDLRGLTAEAHELWTTAHERLLLSTRPGSAANPYLFVGFTLHAALGQTTEAARQLRVAEEGMVDADPGRLRRACLVERKLRYVMEVDELDRYDDVVAERDAVGLHPQSTPFWMRGVFMWPAHLALERVLTAGPEDRPKRVREARRRVREEPRMVDPIFRAYRTAHRAALAQIDRRERTALRLAAKAEKLAIKAAAPAVHFEVARVRARVARGRGQRTETARQVDVAAHLVERYGWIGRGRQVRREFGDLAAVEPERAVPSGPTAGLSRPGPAAGPATAHGGTTRRDRSLHALLALSSASAQSHDPDELVGIALDQLVAQLGAERAFLFLADDHGDVGSPSAARDADGGNLVGVTDYASTVVERVRVEQTALVLTGTEEGAAIGSESAVRHGLRSILAAPLMLEGRFLGVIYLDSRLAKGVFTAGDVAILAAISNHIAISIETARSTVLELAVTAEREKRDLAETLRDSVTIVSATLEPVAVLERTLEMTARVIDYDRAAALLLEDGRWSVAAVAGDLDRPLPFDIDASVHLASLTATSTAAAGPALGPPLLTLLDAPASWLSVPLIARSELLGVLLIASDRAAALGRRELDLASTIAAQGVVAYENARLFKAVERLAVTDDLTGTNNRRHFFDLGDVAFAQARRYHRPMAAIMVDIDHFKQVNDTHGHAAGDDVIRTVATRLRASVRQIDIVGRYGGEEFALILPETDEDVMVVAERLCRAIGAEPVATGTGPLDIHISVGVATMNDGDADLAAVLSRADSALYRAKAEGRNRVVLAG